MNFGSSQIENVIWKQVSQCGRGFNADIKGGKKKFVGDLAKSIMNFIEENVDMNHEVKTMARGRGIEEDIISMCEKVERLFGFDQMNMREKDVEVYRWLIERERRGERLDKFVEWARGTDRAQYIRKYRNDTANIRNDWRLAFSVIGGEDERF